ncbi:transcription elongation factor B polypeptide 3 [Drosophila obscura]|uniref:transcription elongation factor B polypeptide 3 n=1 Tax=Drosophila obscura TaxID=7282 RepID=UPI001BB103CF|nr:transcription elongation factor B polypeptide 3 [Drosophila obscura]
MTSTNNLVDVVRHYQRSIEKHGEDEKRMMHCITKLFNLPIKFEHLQETGIGKTVNALRKFNGEVGVAARTLVTRWKAMVAAEEEPAEPAPSATATTSQEEDSSKSNGRRSSEDDQELEYKGSNSSSGDDGPSSSKRKSRHDETSSKSKSERSSSSKHHAKSSKSESDKKHKSSRHDRSREKEKDKERESHKESKEHRDKKSNGEHKTKDLSSPNKSSSGSISHRNSSSHHTSKSEGHRNDTKEHRKSKHEKSLKEDKDKPQHIDQKTPKDKSERHKSSSSSSKSSKRHHSPQRQEEELATPKPKIAKTKMTKDATGQEESVDGFDSSMGANFDDVLGMLNMPMSSNKKSSSSKAKHVAKPHTTAASSSSTSSASASASVAAAAVAPSYREASSSSSRPVTTKKPELLASTAKLEPLDPSIALELPTISNNYKPLPLNQTVMDVVFNHSGGTQKPSAARYFNESEALAAGISSKTMRTKIYSGVRTGQILQVASLFDLCTRVLQKNIDALEYTGGVPFEVLRPVLERATPQQLLNFEEYNPYLMDDSDILWQMHVTRHCRSQRREEMETWREMFLRCQEEKDRKLSILAESIRASQKISEAPVRKTQLAFVDSMVKPPRNVQRKQEQYGTKGKLIATPAARVAALSSVTPNAAKVGDARLRVLGAGRDTAQIAPMRPKKAPLMAKTLQFMRSRKR